MYENMQQNQGDAASGQTGPDQGSSNESENNGNNGDDDVVDADYKEV
jgi:hypothetical protein